MNSTHLIGSIKDTKAGIFFPPYLYRTKADFVRTVQVEAKNNQSMLHKFPGDYELHVVGQWSEHEGITDFSEPEKIGSVLDLCPID